MMSPIQNIEWNDVTEGVPAFLTLIMMPLAYSIAEGIVWGLLSFIFLKLFSGRFREIRVLTCILGIFFVISFFV